MFPFKKKWDDGCLNKLDVENPSPVQFSSVAQSCLTLSTPWITARQASLSITNSWSLLKLMSIESVMPSSHLILFRPLLLLPPIPPSIRVFSNKLFAWGGHSIGVSASSSVLPMNTQDWSPLGWTLYVSNHRVSSHHSVQFKYLIIVFVIFTPKISTKSSVLYDFTYKFVFEKNEHSCPQKAKHRIIIWLRFSNPMYILIGIEGKSSSKCLYAICLRCCLQWPKGRNNTCLHWQMNKRNVVYASKWSIIQPLKEIMFWYMLQYKWIVKILSMWNKPFIVIK